MAVVLFAPVTFNLAETTRMIQVARALDPSHDAVFLGYEPDYADLIRDAGFDYRALTPSWGRPNGTRRSRSIRVVPCAAPSPATWWAPAWPWSGG